MAWQRTLGEMVEHGTLLALSCSNRRCKAWSEVQPADLLPLLGADHSLWDQQVTCPKCGAPSHYLASPGPGTPFRPLVSGHRPVVGLPGAKPRPELTATELKTATPPKLKALGVDLAIYCAACRVLRMVRLERLIAARSVQPVAAMRWRCAKCLGLGVAVLSWRDGNNEFKSLSFDED